MRKNSPISECIRTYLPDLTDVFIPCTSPHSQDSFHYPAKILSASLLDQHKPDQLLAFCKAKIRRWTENRFTVYMTWGYGSPIRCEVNEIEPKGDELLFQNQYRLDLATSRYDLHKIPSPPLGMMLLEVVPWRQRLGSYLDNLLQKTEFGGFPVTCFQGPECAVQRDLLHPLHAYYLESKKIVGHPCEHKHGFTHSIRIASAWIMFETDRCHTYHDALLHLDRRYTLGGLFQPQQSS